jgi:type IV pilus assembly protein PilW
MRPLIHPRERGFSMVELMVAMLIGLIGTIIIFQVFEVSEGIRRTTTGGGDAQQNGAVALYVMERDLRNSGMGFNDTAFAGCTVLAYDSKRGTPNFTLNLVPVFITPGAATVPDQITAFYGSKQQISNPTMLTVNMLTGGNGSDPITVMNTFDYRPGDMIVLLQPSGGPANCSLMEITGIDFNKSLISHVAGASYQVLETLNNESARFNKPAGLGPEYGGVGSGNVTRIYNLGNLFEPAANPNRPVNNTYAVGANNALTVTAAFVDKNAPSSPLTTSIADNIVQLRAEYGVDDGVAGVGSGAVAITNGGVNVKGDGLVDRWVTPAVFNALPTPPWQYVIAIRLAVVARSAQVEKPRGSNGTSCDATTDGTEAGPPSPVPDQRPRWSGGLIDVSGSGDPDSTTMLHWKCYRYRVFESMVPLRNWIWKSS